MFHLFVVTSSDLHICEIELEQVKNDMIGKNSEAGHREAEAEIFIAKMDDPGPSER